MSVAQYVAPAPRRGRLTKLSDVRARPITWLIAGRVPLAAMSVVAGRPGEGKSTLVLGWGAELTQQGVPFIFIGAEDGLADTVKPRVLAAEGDPDLVYAFASTAPDGGEDIALLPEDVPELERAVKDTGAALVVIDPVQAHMSDDVNTNNDHSVRRALRPLARMAQTTGAAIVVVSHFRKAREGAALDWIGGAGIQGSVRSALLFGRGKADDAFTAADWRYLVHVKCNGAKLAATMSCSMESVLVEDEGRSISTSRVRFVEERERFYAGELE